MTIWGDLDSTFGQFFGPYFYKGIYCCFWKCQFSWSWKPSDSHRSQFFILSHQKFFENRLNTFLKLLCRTFGKKSFLFQFLDFCKKSFFYSRILRFSLNEMKSGISALLPSYLPTPKKRVLFGGGGKTFVDKIVNFCPFEIKKILARLWDQSDLPATYRPNSGRFRPQIKIWNLKNMGFFAIFWENFDTFFFSKIEFGPKSTTNDKKWFVGACLGPKDDPYLILDQFRQTKKIFFFWEKFMFSSKNGPNMVQLPLSPQ